jgi:NADH-quinone oxidoreductase subunit K
MAEITIAHYLLVALALLVLGMLGLALRRNAIVKMMSIELMLNAANLVLVTYSRFRGDETGQVMAFFVMALAASEAAVGIALVLHVLRHRGTIDVEELKELKG